jgi:hypothetical protein
MRPQNLITKRQHVTLSEGSACQQHFLDHFGWEYKGKKKDLKAAYDQAVTDSRRHEPKSHAASANARACWRRKAFAGAPTATR